MFFLSQLKHGFEFMDALVADMVQDDPVKRPTMDDVADRFHSIYKKLDAKKLRSRLVSREEKSDEILVNIVSHWYRRFKYWIQGHPAVVSH